MNMRQVQTTYRRTDRPLTVEEMQAYAPSIFARAPHESRSSRYVYIASNGLVTAMEEEGFLPMQVSQSRTRDENKRAFTKHMIRFRKFGAAVERRVGDVHPEIVLINSHDGTSAYKMYGGLFRLICLNGLVVGDGTVETVSVLHKGDIKNSVIEGAYRVLENTSKAIDARIAWGGIKLSRDEQLAYADSAHQLRFPRDEKGEYETPITPDRLLRDRRYEDRKDDLWTTFNRVQENVMRGGLRATRWTTLESGRRVSRRVSTRQVTGIDQDVKLNRALWTLTEKMAELKA